MAVSSVITFVITIIALVQGYVPPSHITPPATKTTTTTTTTTLSSTPENTPKNHSSTRRSTLLTPLLLLLSPLPSKAWERQDLNAFNGLIFNYRGADDNGLDASTINEPSIPYSDFLKRLDNDEVEFVEFLAPDGDAAYVSLKQKEGDVGKPIRIGEGYPVEKHDGWSSPAFVIRSVKNKGVPYKFVVPGLEKYK